MRNKVIVRVFVCLSVGVLVGVFIQNRTQKSVYLPNENLRYTEDVDNRPRYEAHVGNLALASSVKTHVNLRFKRGNLSYSIERSDNWFHVEGGIANEASRNAKQPSRQCAGTGAKWSNAISDILGHVITNTESWKYMQTVECPYFNVSDMEFDLPRLRFSLNCDVREKMFDTLSWTYNTTDIFEASFADKCVENYIQNCCKGTHRIPNVVHYVWYLKKELNFVGFTSLLGVIRFVKPCLIIFHGDRVPGGKYWDFIVNLSPNIIHLKRERPTFINGRNFKYKEHSGDVMRIEALIKYGGIYLDTDTLIVKPLESLRNYSCVLSNQTSGLLGNAFIMAEKNASFLNLWMDGYKYHFNNTDYIYNSMIFSAGIARTHSDLIHVEYATVSRPHNMLGEKIYDKKFANYKWSHIFGIHLFTRIFTDPLNEFTIRTMKTTAGSIFRHILFGNKELCA